MLWHQKVYINWDKFGIKCPKFLKITIFTDFSLKKCPKLEFVPNFGTKSGQFSENPEFGTNSRISGQTATLLQTLNKVTSSSHCSMFNFNTSRFRRSSLVQMKGYLGASSPMVTELSIRIHRNWSMISVPNKSIIKLIQQFRVGNKKKFQCPRCMVVYSSKPSYWK